ncbi:MAG TPA: cadmium-translocating P-type ATPase [Candidatus Avacidaminococcus intestinavium]|uniref:Cd(2+)-exporting ATPase n=1 Tax=Candidatus Avacidaminococcus intestinavium TaxID=2840684 RepID=A0A9D1SKF0_9FIRM|nr:cadmium-translocating P-type ATPase [Candidatus Avacidaminococcus intestinavium]
MNKHLYKIIIGALFFTIALAVDFPNDYITLGLFVVSYFVVGGDVVQRALRNISRGKVFDENFLMFIATVGAFLIGEYSEAVGVMLFYQIGELFQSYAVDKSRRSIAELMDIRPDYANVMRNGNLETVDPDEVEIGETIVVKPGERVPLDGFVLSGTSMLDTASLTGEALPREVHVGSEVLSGCINLHGLVEVEVTKEFGDSTVSKILDLVENAAIKKSSQERFITKFARYYTPTVVILAVLLAIVPPLVTGGSFVEWLRRALIFLVISCPCALVISIPLSFFGGIGGASKCGILVKGGNYLEALADTDVVVFDKTGTLTKGTFAVTAVNAVQKTREELLYWAAYAENHSNHPIAQSLKKSYGKDIDEHKITGVTEIPGFGVEAIVDGHVVLAGNSRLLTQKAIEHTPSELVGTQIYVALDGAFIGSIIIADELKADAKQAIRDLKASGVQRIVMLTGDAKAVGQAVAQELEITEAFTELLPGDKVTKLEELLQTKRGNSKIAFVGDGVNDAPVLARSDVGIAMGALGSDAAIEAADIVIMTDEPSKIAVAIKIARKTLRIAKQNIILALGVKGIVLVLGALGMANMWAAVFADVGVAMLAILNAIRVLNAKYN